MFRNVTGIDLLMCSYKEYNELLSREEIINMLSFPEGGFINGSKTIVVVEI